jgi:hypothetical protein
MRMMISVYVYSVLLWVFLISLMMMEDVKYKFYATVAVVFLCIVNFLLTGTVKRRNEK